MCYGPKNLLLKAIPLFRSLFLSYMFPSIPCTVASPVNVLAMSRLSYL